MKCLLVFAAVTLSATFGQFYNPGVEYNTLFGTNGLGNPATTNYVGAGGTTGVGFGYGSVGGERKTYNAGTCNYLMGSTSMLTFCSRYRQACSEILVNTASPANTIRVCDGCMLNFILNCNNVQELAVVNSAVGKK